MHSLTMLVGDDVVGDGPLFPKPGRYPGHFGMPGEGSDAIVNSPMARRNALARMVEEQVALRHVATLVAHGVPQREVFDAVASQLGCLLQGEFVALDRYEQNGPVTIVASWSANGDTGITPPVGSRWSLEGESVAALVMRSGRPERLRYDKATSELAAWSREHGIRAGVGSPIRVNGRLWGVAVVLSRSPTAQADGIEGRMLNFTELVAAAIANTESREELKASRARVVVAADEARRRVERDLHDGVQQRLVSLGMGLRMAQADLRPGNDKVDERLSRAVREVDDIAKELREVSRGLHPAVLSAGGLAPALKTLARRSAIPVRLRVRGARRLADGVEVAVYYVVAEALTNAAKHANASAVEVDLTIEETAARIRVRDDGVGGADLNRGWGLIGLKDRVESLCGSIQLTSRPGHGTSLLISIPIEDPNTPPPC
jgi:signal transduction histidine kinase